MKVCILGNTNNPVTGKPNDPYSWFVKTYQQGLQLNEIDPLLIDYKSQSLFKTKRDLSIYKPDWCFTHLSFHKIYSTDRVLETFSELYKKYNIKFIHTCSDARKEDRYMGNLSNSFYAAFVGNKELLTNAKNKWKIPVFYSPYSSLTYKKMAEPIPELINKKAVFTGSINAHTDRKQFIDLLKEYGVQLQIYGTQSKNDMRHRTPELSTSALCILGLCTGYDIDGFIDVRPFQYMGAGACFLGRKFKNVDDILPPDLYYPFDGYERKDAKYVKDTWQKIMKTDTWPMRTKAFKFIQQNHSSKIRINQIIDILNNI